MALSDYLADKILDHTLRGITYTSPTDIYMALFTNVPNSDGTGGTEVAGGSYARQVMSFADPAVGAIANDSSMSFTGMPGCVLEGAALYDAVSGGHMLYFGFYSSPRRVTAGATEDVLPGDVTLVLR
jgi:hypothetical protein